MDCIIEKAPEKNIGIFRRINSILNSRGSRRIVFREVTDADRIEIMNLCAESYRRANLSASPPFDKFDLDSGTRYFELAESSNGHFYTSKAVRIVNRKSSGILPVELSLLGPEEIQNRFPEMADPRRMTLQQSTMSDKDKSNLQLLLESYKNTKQVYEAGRLAGNKDGFLSPYILVLGLAKTGFEEQWDAVIQTQKPSHARDYLSSGLPYHQITSEFYDHYGRPAVVLALEGDEFRKDYERNFKYMADELFSIPARNLV